MFFVVVFSLFLLCYTYVGYFALLKILTLFQSPKKLNKDDYFPSVIMLVAAYNEEDCIEEKIENCLSLDYPMTKLSFWFVTDGSNDRTNTIIEKYSNRYSQIKLFYEKERKGKINAIQRVQHHIDSEIVVFTDANSILNIDAIRLITNHFQYEKVAVVAGNKIIISKTKTKAAATLGEGLYWKFENRLKQLESDFDSVIGAAGELFAIRKELWQKIRTDTIIEDFLISVLPILDGYQLVFEPKAMASETASDGVAEELKRKKRIATGSWQACFYLMGSSKFWNQPRFIFQYFSHKFLRLLSPFLMILILLLNVFLIQEGGFWKSLLYLQGIFYFMALCGLVLSSRKVKINLFSVPFYFLMMNYAIMIGTFDYFLGNRKVVWEKSKRL